MGCNTFTTDYSGYKTYYDLGIFDPSMEYGFVLIVILLKKIGVPYQLFLFIYEFFGIMVLLFCAKKCKTNLHVVFFLYTLTALFMDTNEIRQFMAYIMYTYALILLSERKVFLFYVIAVVCVLFHKTAFILLPMPGFILLHEKRTFYSLYFYCILLCCVLIFLNSNKIPGIDYVVNHVLHASKSVYFTNSTRFGFLKCFFGNFTNLLIAFLSLKIMRKNLVCYSVVDIRYAKTVVYSILYLSIAMPLCQLDTEFIRFFRYSVCSVILLVGVLLRNNQILGKHIRENMILIMLLFVICYEIAFQHYRVLGEVLNNNLFNFM